MRITSSHSPHSHSKRAAPKSISELGILGKVTGRHAQFAAHSAEAFDARRRRDLRTRRREGDGVDATVPVEADGVQILGHDSVGLLVLGGGEAGVPDRDLHDGVTTFLAVAAVVALDLRLAAGHTQLVVPELLPAAQHLTTVGDEALHRRPLARASRREGVHVDEAVAVAVDAPVLRRVVLR